MSDGSTSTTGFSWSVEGGGAVSVSGLYTAPSASQETPATITATKSSKKGTATINSIYEPATIVSKGPITGKIGGSTTAFTTMFTATNSAFSDYEFVITPPSAGSFNGSGVFTLSDNASGTVTVKATHKTQTSVTATATITATPKLTGLVLSSVTNTTVTGSPTTPAESDTITITDSGVAGVARVDGVPQGALTGALAYDVEGTDSSLMTVDLTSNVLTITLSAPITSEDTKITIRTNPGSDIFRTYTVKSGA